MWGEQGEGVDEEDGEEEDTENSSGELRGLVRSVHEVGGQHGHLGAGTLGAQVVRLLVLESWNTVRKEMAGCSIITVQSMSLVVLSTVSPSYLFIHLHDRPTERYSGDDG